MIEDSNSLGTKCPHRRHFTSHYQNWAQVIFLIAFVVFLVVGISLTYVGFLEYGSFGTNSRSLKILGLVALLLCIGFLIAACVIISDCVSTVIEQPMEGDPPYETLSPSDCTTSFTTVLQSSSQHTDLVMHPFDSNIGSLCPSCSQRFMVSKSSTACSFPKQQELPTLATNSQGSRSCEFTDFAQHQSTKIASIQDIDIERNLFNP